MGVGLLYRQRLSVVENLDFHADLTVA